MTLISAKRICGAHGHARALCVLAVVALATACDSNPFDAAQQPTVSVAYSAAEPFLVINWQPGGAQLIRVYRGAEAGDGYGESLMWSIAANTSNSLASGISYGAAPSSGHTDVAARPLVAGERYTVQVTRRDPKGAGDGFTNTSNRYVGTTTFTYTPP